MQTVWCNRDSSSIRCWCQESWRWMWCQLVSSCVNLLSVSNGQPPEDSGNTSWLLFVTVEIKDLQISRTRKLVSFTTCQCFLSQSGLPALFLSLSFYYIILCVLNSLILVFCLLIMKGQYFLIRLGYFHNILKLGSIIMVVRPWQYTPVNVLQ